MYEDENKDSPDQSDEEPSGGNIGAGDGLKRSENDLTEDGRSREDDDAPEEKPILARDLNEAETGEVEKAAPSSLMRTGAARRAGELPSMERRNWLIHYHYVREDVAQTKALIKEQLDESGGFCEYAQYIRGLLLRQEGRIDESLDAFQQCAALSPRNPQYVKQIGRSLFLVGKHKSAIDVLAKAAHLDDGDWEVHHWTAMCYRQIGDIQETKTNLMKALQLNKHERSLCLMADVCQQQGDRLMAIECYKKCIELSPDNADTQTKLGLLYLDTGSYQQAFEALGRALSVNPSHSGAILAAGSMMQKYGDYDVAVSKYRLAATITPDSAQLWNNIGMCFYGKNKYVAAVSCLKRANYLSPLDWKIQYNLGLVHMALQQYASAFHFCSAAVNLQPNSAVAFMTLGVILTRLEDFDNAVSAYERACQLDALDPILPLNAAVCNFKAGRPSDAQRCYDAYQKRLAKTAQRVEQETIDLANSLQAELQDAARNRSAVMPSTAQTTLSDNTRSDTAGSKMHRADTSASTGSGGSGLDKEGIGMPRRRQADTESLKTMTSRHIKSEDAGFDV